MHRANATVTTENARRYLTQLCKHFGHKVTTDWHGDEGFADFSMGRCDFSATAGKLHMACRAQTEDDLVKVQDIVGDHLVRFAWREDLTVDWRMQPEAANQAG